MKLMKKTNKFLSLCKNKTKVVVLSLSFIVIKIILALFLTFKFGDLMKTSLLWCIFFIFLTTILYEVARTKKCDIAIFILVACGYPIRFLSGLWCVIPNLFKEGIQLNELNIQPLQIILYLFSIAALGGFSSTIPWVYEAFKGLIVLLSIIMNIYLKVLRNDTINIIIIITANLFIRYLRKGN